MKLSSNLSAVVQEMQALKGHLDSEVRLASREVASQAKELAQTGTNVGVYLTPPGHYLRSGDLLARIDAQPELIGPGRYAVTVLNDSEHASQVEYGSQYGDQREVLSPESAAQLAERLGDSFTPLYLGRSGSNYTAPNPAITRAAVWAGYALDEQFGLALLKVSLKP